MKKLLFILILFLFFIQLKPVIACHHYDTSTGQCLDYLIGNVYDSREVEQIEETIQAPTRTISDVSGKSTSFSLSLITLIFQLLGIVILLILLVVMIEELAKSL